MLNAGLLVLTRCHHNSILGPPHGASECAQTPTSCDDVALDEDGLTEWDGPQVSD